MPSQWVAPPHLIYIDATIMAAINGKLKERIIVIQTPPRHGKSEYVSHWLPAWYVSMWPDRRVILTMYGADPAENFGRRVQRSAVICSRDYFGTDIHFSKGRASEWVISEYGGGMLTAGVGGGITGLGADLLIVDDPIKNAAEAMSKSSRDKIWDWWQSTAYTRLSPDGIAIVMHTPWHTDDLGSMLYKKSQDGTGAPVHLVKLPALAESDDLLGRKYGEPLWPEVWPTRRLAEIQRTQTSYWWLAMYQCRPTVNDRAAWPEEYWTDLFVNGDDWPDSFEWSVVACDPSKGKQQTKNGDFTAMVFIGLSGGKLWVDAEIERIPLAEVVSRVLAFSLANRCDEVGFEADQFQELLIHEWDRIRERIGLPPKPAIRINTGGVNKNTRIERLGPYFHDKAMRFRRTPGTERLLAQLTEFPLADHDDGPDALEMATRLIQRVAEMSMETEETY